MPRVVVASVLCAVFAVGCASTSSSPSSPLASTDPSHAPSAVATEASAPTTSAVAGTASPTTGPPLAAGSLPVHGSAQDLAIHVRLASAIGRDGDVFVSIPTPTGSVIVALLDARGRPRAGWPVTLDGATACEQLLSADDGSIRLVCAPEELNRELNTGVRVYALGATGRPLAGWPVDLDGAASGRLIDDRLILVDLLPLGDVVVSGQPSHQVALDTIDADGTLRTGLPVLLVETCCGEQWAVGPDGTAYGVTPAGDRADGSIEASEITAVDTSGVRPGWPVHIEGIASGPAFGPDGRILVTVGSYEGDRTRVLAFERGGKAASAASARLPLDTAIWGVDCAPVGPEPPVATQDGTMFVVSEIETPVFGLDPSLSVLPGWPYRPATPLERPGRNDPRNEISCGSYEAPAAGPNGALYLPLQARRSTVGGSLSAIDANGEQRSGWPVELDRPGAGFWSLVVGSDGTAYALAVEPEAGDTASATLLAIASDGRVLYRSTIIDP